LVEDFYDHMKKEQELLDMSYKESVRQKRERLEKIEKDLKKVKKRVDKIEKTLDKDEDYDFDKWEGTD
jgi:septal ring factor EnvC (AmiA/AmiB activator)